MTKPSQFLTLLHDITSARHMGAGELAHEMEVPGEVARSWLYGWSAPTADQLPKLARVLAADPLDVAFGWLLDQAPELEPLLYDGILAPRGTKLSHSSDLALLGPKRKPVTGALTVDDPNDNPE